MNVKKEIAQTLRQVLRLFDGGRKWTKGTFERNGSYCLLGAVNRVTGTGERYIHDVKRALARHTPEGYGLMNFNDDEKTKFDDVRRLIQRTIRACYR
jgi:hypothetical protein